MKLFLKTLPILLFGHLVIAQTKKQALPINPSTGLITVLDSVKVGAGYPIFWVKAMVDDWGNYIAYRNNRVRNIFNYDPGEKEATFGFDSIYEDEKRSGKYFKNGQLNYISRIHGKTNNADKTNGNVSFKVNFESRGEYILFELTRLKYMSPKNELAAFEDQAVLSADGVHFLTEAQIPWSRIKREYYQRLQVIGGTLREYLTKHYRNYIKR